jgi:hypothetical protein
MKSGDWLAAGVLIIPDSAGLASDKKRWRRICNFFQPMGRKGLLPYPIIGKKM